MAKSKLLLLFLAAFVFRFLLIFVAHHGDLNNNISWGNLLVERGPVEFYGSADANDWPYSAPNQPPLTLLLFGSTSLIYKWVESAAWYLNGAFAAFPSSFVWFWESEGMDILVKLLGILADLGIGWLIYNYFRRKGERLALTLCAVWLVNPVIWYNSSVWGQTDSIVNLLGLLSVLALLDKKLVKFAFFLVLSLLFKGSLAVLAPLLLIAAIKQGNPVRQWVKAFLIAGITAIAVSVWFHPQPDLVHWLAQLYNERILPGEIGYLTANAFNFWWLVDPGKVLDSTAYLGMPARVWGLIMAALGMAGLGYWLAKKGLAAKRLFLSLAFIALISFLFLTRVHERYLYPFFPYATLGLGFIPWMWLPYIVLSATHLLNLYHLFWAPPIPLLEMLYTNDFFMTSIALVTILFFGFLLRQLKTSKI